MNGAKRVFQSPLFIWAFAVLIFFYVAIGIVLVARNQNIVQMSPFFFVYLTLPVVFLIIHGTQTIPAVRFAGFMLFAFLASLVIEYLGIHYGIFFISRYTYASTRLSILDVPVIIPIYWATLSYGAYSVTNSFLKWQNRRKPENTRNILKVLPLIIIDILILISLDLFIDPIAVHLRLWKWEINGSFFNVPLGNYLGWFLTSCVIHGGYRIFELLKPKERESKTSLYIIPVLAYAVLEVLLFVQALKLHFFLAIFLSGSIFLAIFVTNIILLKKWALQRLPKDITQGNYLKKLLRAMLLP